MRAISVLSVRTGGVVNYSLTKRGNKEKTIDEVELVYKKGRDDGDEGMLWQNKIGWHKREGKEVG